MIPLLIRGIIVAKEDESIKLIASNADAFAGLEAFRKELPLSCKSQIDTIGNAFAGIVEITYKDSYGKPIYVPKNPRQIAYDENWMRLYYSGMQVKVPCKGVQVGLHFAE